MICNLTHIIWVGIQHWSYQMGEGAGDSHAGNHKHHHISSCRASKTDAKKRREYSREPRNATVPNTLLQAGSPGRQQWRAAQETWSRRQLVWWDNASPEEWGLPTGTYRRAIGDSTQRKLKTASRGVWEEGCYSLRPNTTILDPAVSYKPLEEFEDTVV